MSNDFQNIKNELSSREFIEQETNQQVTKVGDEKWRVNPCPFCGHNDCFTIFADSTHCFSCGFTGDIFTFVREYRNLLSNYEALIYVAQKIGYHITNQRIAKQDAKLLDIKQIAVDYYHDNLINRCRDEPIKYLLDGQEHETTVLEYQTEVREHSLEVLKKLKIGYADGGLLAHVMRQELGKYDTKDLVKIGLAHIKGYDYFPKCIYVYPHFVNGQISHFSQKDPMKAVEFQSQKEHRHPQWRFYGQSAINSDDLVVVEGENDQLKIIDKGAYPYCITTIGQLSEAQIEYLKQRRKDKRTYLGFDNDDSGRKYTDKVILALGGYDIFVMRFCPIWKDIDELLKAADNPKELFTTLRENAVDSWSYRLHQIPPDTSTFELLDTIKPLLVDLIKCQGVIYAEAFINDVVKKYFNSSQNALKPLTKLIKELDKIDDEETGNEPEAELVRLAKPIDSEFCLAQDYHNNILSYTIYLPVKIGDKLLFSPHLITSNRECIPLTRENLESRGIYLPNNYQLPTDTRRWSTDVETSYNVWAYLDGEGYTGQDMFHALTELFSKYLWHPNDSLKEILALVTMLTYVYMIFEQIPYPTFAGTKRVGKTRALELIEQVAFNALLGVDFSDAYIYRKIERDRSTLLIDEADMLAMSKHSDSNTIKILRAGYKRSAKVGRIDEDGNPVDYYCYGVKFLASVSDFESALADRIIWLNPERIPPDEHVDRLLFRKEIETFKILRNKLYTWSLSNVSTVYDAYANLSIPQEYHRDISDRDEELWSGLLAIAKTVNEDVFNRCLGYARTNKQRKEAEALAGAEFSEVKFINMLLEFIDDKNITRDNDYPDFYRLYEIENYCKEYFNWSKVSNRTIPGNLKRLKLIDDKDPDKDRIRVPCEVDTVVNLPDSRQEVKRETKRITLYHIDRHKLETVAYRYGVIDEPPTEKPDNDEPPF